uniref:Uncharacterized protein n=1 Tax=Anguilla anguilla TaxID=7936 RepID=A0A0E9QZ78_ANGAN
MICSIVCSSPQALSGLRLLSPL